MPVARAVPFHKRFPGRHAVSALVVLPSGNRVEIAGPSDAATAELILALLQSDTSGLTARGLMAQLKRELDAVSAEAAAPAATTQDSEPGASGSVDQNPPPVESAAADPARAQAGPDPEGSAGGGVEVDDGSEDTRG